MITAFSLRHKLSKEATEDLLHLVELHLPRATATTSFALLKQFRSFLLLPSQHFYCLSCKVYIGNDIGNRLKCLDCDSTYSVEEVQKKSSFFLVLSIEEQLRSILESQCSKMQLGSEATKSTSYDVSSIQQSLCYHGLPLSPYDITLTINTDGFPMYKSSGYSMWPLELAVNELPEHERWDNLLLAAIWFGREKRNINCFLRPFVEEMNHLSSTGFAWTDQNGASQTTRVFPGPVTVDTVARALVMNMTMFNGAYGCAWCESEGTVVSKGSGHSRVYPLEQKQPKERTAVSFKKHAKKADARGTPIQGIKGANILFKLNHFVFPTNFVVDYMHAVCLGFVRSVTCLWLSSKRKKFNLSVHIKELKQRLTSLQPVHEIGRLPRSLDERAYWKASEWLYWLLYYSPIVLDGLLPNQYFSNWVEFVDIMHFLLAKSIPLDRLDEVQQKLMKFRKDFQSLYGITEMKYNTHLLIHLAGTVKTGDHCGAIRLSHSKL